MTRTTRTRWVIACVAALVLLAGCGGAPGGVDSQPRETAATFTTPPTEDPGRTEDPAGGGDDEVAVELPGLPGLPTATTATFTTPPTEDPGRTEGPAGGGENEVAVEVAGLPIGGFHEVDPVDPTVRCVVINWSGPPDLVPPEANLEITGLAVEPAGAYGWAADGCNGFGPCLDSPGVLDAGGQCGVWVDQVAAVPDWTGVLSVTSGSIDCAPEARAVCEQFAAEVEAAPPDNITWEDALTTWTSPTVTGTGTGTGTVTGTGTAPDSTGTATSGTVTSDTPSAEESTAPGAPTSTG